MAHEGKIACHFPGAGNPNHDVYGITFLPAGGSASNLLTIDKVYYLSASDVATMKSMSTDEERLAYLRSSSPTHRVWELQSSKVLLAGTQFVSFEFIPSQEDITLDHIGIFTADTYSGTTVNFAIYHESGLVVAKTNADTDSSTEEKYGLTGQRRIVAVNGVLKRGLKYYIQYTDQNGNTIHPAYFQNSQSSETGETGKYKVFTHNQAQNKSVADLSNVSSYIGVVSDINDFVNAQAGALMICGGFDNYNTNYAYIRNNSYHETCTSVGDGNNLTLAYLDYILSLNDGSLFYWNGGNYVDTKQIQGLWYHEYHRRIGTTYSKSNYVGILSSKEDLIDPSYSIGKYGSWDNGYGQLHVFRKKADVDVDAFIDLTAAKYSGKENYKTADIIKASYDADGNKSVMTQGEIKGQNVNAHVFTLKAGYSYDFTVDSDGTLHGYTPSNAPSQWVVNRIYYCEETGNYPGGGYAPAGSICLWDGTALNTINYYSYGMSTIFDIETDIVSQVVEDISLADMIQELGNASIFRTNEVYSTDYISEGLRSAQIESDTKKFYLEINGDEK
jgi:hypothetical protein